MWSRFLRGREHVQSQSRLARGFLFAFAHGLGEQQRVLFLGRLLRKRIFLFAVALLEAGHAECRQYFFRTIAHFAAKYNRRCAAIDGLVRPAKHYPPCEKKQCVHMDLPEARGRVSQRPVGLAARGGGIGWSCLRPC